MITRMNNPATTENLFEEADGSNEEQERLIQVLERIETRLDALEAIEEEPPVKPVKRLVALETEGDGAIGDTHEAFMSTLRGF